MTLSCHLFHMHFPLCFALRKWPSPTLFHNYSQSVDKLELPTGFAENSEILTAFDERSEILTGSVQGSEILTSSFGCLAISTGSFVGLEIPTGSFVGLEIPTGSFVGLEISTGSFVCLEIPSGSSDILTGSGSQVEKRPQPPVLIYQKHPPWKQKKLSCVMLKKVIMEGWVKDPPSPPVQYLGKGSPQK